MIDVPLIEAADFALLFPSDKKTLLITAGVVAAVVTGIYLHGKWAEKERTRKMERERDPNSANPFVR